MFILRAGALLALFVCAGCAGRAPNPVSVVQAQDRNMDCTAIFAEVSANNQRVQELAEEQGFKVAQNVVTGVAGFIVPVFGSGWTGKAPPLKKLQLSRVVNNILRR
jgi:hypothetical protein